MGRRVALAMVPKDQMSVGVPYPIWSCASGLRQYGCANDITVLREDRIGTNSTPTIGQFHVSEADISLPIVHQDVVGLNIYGSTLIRAFSVPQAVGST